MQHKPRTDAHDAQQGCSCCHHIAFSTVLTEQTTSKMAAVTSISTCESIQTLQPDPGMHQLTSDPSSD